MFKVTVTELIPSQNSVDGEKELIRLEQLVETLDLKLLVKAINFPEEFQIVPLEKK